MSPVSSFLNSQNYLHRLCNAFDTSLNEKIEYLAKDILNAWINKKSIFICGNGGSAANAIHIANDFHYGIGACGEGDIAPGVKIEALTANSQYSAASQ